jgi:hypothetical protein
MAPHVVEDSGDEIAGGPAPIGNAAVAVNWHPRSIAPNRVSSPKEILKIYEKRKKGVRPHL